MAIGIQRQIEMNPITIVFDGINDHLHSRIFLSRFREPTSAQGAVWPATEDILESIGAKSGICTSPGWIDIRVMVMVALVSEEKYDVIISAPNRKEEAKNLKSLREELPAVWSDISNAMRGFKDPSQNMLVLDEVLGWNCPISAGSSS